MRKSFFFPNFVVFFTLFSTIVLGQTPSTQKPEAGTGLEGVILIGPIHGGPTRQGVPDSKPLAHTEFVVAKENKTVASFQTDDKGRFHVSLPPGHYTISRKDLKATLGNYGPFEVDIAAGEMKRVEWSCDSGIR